MSKSRRTRNASNASKVSSRSMLQTFLCCSTRETVDSISRSVELKEDTQSPKRDQPEEPKKDTQPVESKKDSSPRCPSPKEDQPVKKDTQPVESKKDSPLLSPSPKEDPPPSPKEDQPVKKDTQPVESKGDSPPRFPSPKEDQKNMQSVKDVQSTESIITVSEWKKVSTKEPIRMASELEVSRRQKKKAKISASATCLDVPPVSKPPVRRKSTSLQYITPTTKSFKLANLDLKDGSYWIKKTPEINKGDASKGQVTTQSNVSLDEKVMILQDSIPVLIKSHSAQRPLKAAWNTSLKENISDATFQIQPASSAPLYREEKAPQEPPMFEMRHRLSSKAIFDKIKQSDIKGNLEIREVSTTGSESSEASAGKDKKSSHSSSNNDSKIEVRDVEHCSKEDPRKDSLQSRTGEERSGILHKMANFAISGQKRKAQKQKRKSSAIPIRNSWTDALEQNQLIMKQRKSSLVFPTSSSAIY